MRDTTKQSLCTTFQTDHLINLCTWQDTGTSKGNNIIKPPQHGSLFNEPVVTWTILKTFNFLNVDQILLTAAITSIYLIVSEFLNYPISLCTILSNNK